MLKSSADLPFMPAKPWLAPLAGYSNLPFRLLCRIYGCAAAYTEMVSAKGLVYDSAGTRELLNTCPEDSPLVVQIFGSERKIIGRAVKCLVQMGFVNIYLNAGCPVKKVVKTGAGAALLKDLPKLFDLIKVILENNPKGKPGLKFVPGGTAKQYPISKLAES